MDTIFALSSGAPPSGVAVIRISGPACRFVAETMCGNLPQSRTAALRKIRDPKTQEILDEGFCIWFAGPHSFTGEDCAEFQVHGSPAIVRAVLSAIGSCERTRHAEPGEFSRRAFENGRLDLTEIEGLADLVRAQTESQRRQAQMLSGGALGRKLETWRDAIIRMRAMIEADFDFAEESDVPDSVADQVWPLAAELSREIRRFIDDGNRGEIIRDGFQIVLMGKPNSGKSSLINALAGRDIAIVTPEAGTTRDLIEVHLDIGGYAVTFVDTAGMRDAEGMVEREGIRRAKDRAGTADLMIWLDVNGDRASGDDLPVTEAPVWVLRSKDDAGGFGGKSVSAVSGHGIENLLSRVKSLLAERLGGGEPVSISRERHRAGLANCARLLEMAAADSAEPIEIRAEYLREASDAIGRITGKIDVEDLLDVIFSEFCIGK